MADWWTATGESYLGLGEKNLEESASEGRHEAKEVEARTSHAFAKHTQAGNQGHANITNHITSKL